MLEFLLTHIFYYIFMCFAIRFKIFFKKLFCYFQKYAIIIKKFAARRGINEKN